jgi:hypothetical protein
LHPRSLLREHELATGEVDLGLAQEHRDLEREGECPVEVLVQAVEVARAIAEEQRRRP